MSICVTEYNISVISKVYISIIMSNCLYNACVMTGFNLWGRGVCHLLSVLQCYSDGSWAQVSRRHVTLTAVARLPTNTRQSADLIVCHLWHVTPCRLGLFLLLIININIICLIVYICVMTSVTASCHTNCMQYHHTADLIDCHLWQVTPCTVAYTVVLRWLNVHIA